MADTPYPKTKPATRGAALKDVKVALNHLGYYFPRKGGVTDQPDQDFFTALFRFQKDQGLRPDEAFPLAQTTQSLLNEALEDVPFRRLGPRYYLWRTAGDDKVRGQHAARAGQIFKWDVAPPGGHPGEDYNCRCWAEPAYPSVAQEKYLEERVRLMASEQTDAIDPSISPLDFLGGGGVVKTGIKVITKRNINWTFGQYKSATRWSNQLKKRNWSDESITKALKHGKKFRAPNNINPNNKAFRYEYKGSYIVRDERTKEILQLGKAEFKRPSISRGKK
jgi:hypothetical protein